jgi:hypothetical protein
MQLMQHLHELHPHFQQNKVAKALQPLKIETQTKKPNTLNPKPTFYTE